MMRQLKQLPNMMKDTVEDDMYYELIDDNHDWLDIKVGIVNDKLIPHTYWSNWADLVFQALNEKT